METKDAKSQEALEAEVKLLKKHVALLRSVAELVADDEKWSGREWLGSECVDLLAREALVKTESSCKGREPVVNQEDWLGLFQERKLDLRCYTNPMTFADEDTSWEVIEHSFNYPLERSVGVGDTGALAIKDYLKNERERENG